MSTPGLAEVDAGAEPLPRPAGPLSELVLDLMQGRRPVELAPDRPLAELVHSSLALVADPIADRDLQLALYVLYEQHYRAYVGVDPEREWDLELLEVRALLEAPFFDALEAEVPMPGPVDPSKVGDRLFAIEADDDGPSLSRWLAEHGTLDHVKEFMVQRSAYQLKEADPHSWVIPRITGAPKSALVEIQADEYGGGRPERMHSHLFAGSMRTLGLDDREGAYIDHLPGITLATVNAISSAALRRAKRGMVIGNLTMFEMTSSGANRNYARALRRLGLGADATDFFDEHVEADAAHENIAAYDLAGGLARQQPQLAHDILRGALTLLYVDGRFAEHLLDSWQRGESSLVTPLPEGSPSG